MWKLKFGARKIEGCEKGGGKGKISENSSNKTIPEISHSNPRLFHPELLILCDITSQRSNSTVALQYGKQTSGKKLRLLT